MSVGRGVVERLNGVAIVFQKLAEGLIHGGIRRIVGQRVVVHLEIRAVVYMGTVGRVGIALDLAPCVSSRTDRLGLQRL